MVDVCIIGAGVVGCSIARELSRYQLKTVVLERGSDVCEGTSKANSGIVHAGFDAKPGSKKAIYNVEGSEMMEELSKELDFPYRRNGSMILAFSEEDRATLEKLLEQGVQNGLKAGAPDGMEIISGEAARAKEKNLSENVVCALWVPQGAIVVLLLLTVVMGENANVNGVDFRRDTEVLKIEKTGEGEAHYKLTLRDVRTGEERCEEAKAVVNAAGVYADVFHNMVSERKLHITARRGQYMLMDKVTTGFVDSTIFQCPSKMGKGVLVTPTAHGNMMIGQPAEDIEDKEDLSTNQDGLDRVIQASGLSADKIPTRSVITSFAGLRAHEDGGDFIIGECEDAPFFFDAAGIESPGLSSAPAIGKHLASMVAEKLTATVNNKFDGHRVGIPCMAHATMEERAALIKENPLYANVICRCETVTEGEIVDAIQRPVGARTLDGIKRRVRAGMGRCQAGFCMPKQADLISRELGIELNDIEKNNAGSGILVGFTK